MQIHWHPSPNFDTRDGCRVSMLVLHYTGMKTAEDALTRLCDPLAKVSAHYVVDEDGRVTQLVREEDRAWHAGVSCWRGEARVNHHSIGIEIVNPGHEFGYRPFTSVQMQSVLELSKGIVSRHAIESRNIVGHSDVAPARKEDPGELFDWAWLAANGLGLWPTVGSHKAYARGNNEISLSDKLRAYGYEVPENGLIPVITAFQRHFRPKALTGQWDEECDLLLAELLEMAV